ncbi:hypothetical protein CYY_005316 [Polysphondylium violaceum]|uniref:Transmembrane protein n=1 Tax=Polysphondylium violaceum TaxID=133409 RepID=A0A8J4PTZ5_9MYCE|nr:hypothetical protein CYY_005316 [Polysphondylium violaceum]
MNNSSSGEGEIKQEQQPEQQPEQQNVEIKDNELKVEDLTKEINNVDDGRLCKHKDNCIISVLKTLGRGFIIGYGLRASLALVTGIVMRRLYKNPRKLIDQSILHKDPIGFGLFLAFYTGGYKAVLCLLRNIRKKDDGINAAIAGFISGGAMAFSKSTEMALYLFARALESLFNAGVKRGYLKSYKHGDSLLFCLCTAILFHAFVWEPNSVRPSYLKFLSKVAGSKRDLGKITSVIREMYYQQKALTH